MRASDTMLSTGYPQTYPQADPDRQRWWATGRVWWEDQLPLFVADEGGTLRYRARAVLRKRQARGGNEGPSRETEG